MPVKVNGDWKSENNTLVKVDGDWKDSVAVCVKVDGEWKCNKKPQPTYEYGKVYYKADDSSEEVLSVEIQSIDEFNSLCSDLYDWTTNINGVTLSNNAENIIVGIEIGSKITSIGDHFLFECTSFNQPLTLPSNLASIGIYFLHKCTSFNQPLILPSNLTSIGGFFLHECQSLNGSNSAIDVGQLSSDIIHKDWETFATDESSALAYTNGIYIKGDNADAWIAKFPDSSSQPYRKLKAL